MSIKEDLHKELQDILSNIATNKKFTGIISEKLIHDWITNNSAEIVSGNDLIQDIEQDSKELRELLKKTKSFIEKHKRIERSKNLIKVYQSEQIAER
jgi:hypothetical protein